MVVVGNKRLVLIEFAKSFNRLDWVGIDNPIPDEVLSLLGGQFRYEFMDGVKLLHARHVEAAAEFIERADDCRIAVDLHGIVDLYARKMLVKESVVFPEFLVVNHKEGRAVLLRECEQRRWLHRFMAPINLRR